MVNLTEVINTVSKVYVKTRVWSLYLACGKYY